MIVSRGLGRRGNAKTSLAAFGMTTLWSIADTASKIYYGSVFILRKALTFATVTRDREWFVKNG